MEKMEICNTNNYIILYVFSTPSEKILSSVSIFSFC